MIKSAIMSKEGNLFQPRDWKTIEVEAHERMANGVRLNLCSESVNYLASDLPDSIKQRLPCGKKINVCYVPMTPEEKVSFL